MIFETYGPVESVHILPDSRVGRQGETQKSGFVTYERAEGARVAIQVLNDVSQRARLSPPQRPFFRSLARHRHSYFLFVRLGARVASVHL